MTAICLTIIDSSIQIVSGIPKTVSIKANVPSTIFYTLDGREPTLESAMYTGPIFMPVDKLKIVLKVFASNGVCSTPIITECYETNIVDSNARLPHAATTARAGEVFPNAYPFGTAPFQPNQEYLNPADSGVTVFNTAKPALPNQFNAEGQPTAFTNKPYNPLNYQIIYTDKNAEGEQGHHIGNLPSTVTIQHELQPTEETSEFTTMFNPRALVIFQDYKFEDKDDPPQINKQFFTLDDTNHDRDGTFYYGSKGDSTAPPSGTFIRANYNPKEGTLTQYYRDSWSNRWIISTSQYQPNSEFSGNLSPAARAWGGKVFEWIPHQRRVLG